MVTDLARPSDELLSTGSNGAPTDLMVGPDRGGETRAAERVADESNARQLEALRQDFVANVSHESKGPAAAVTPLAEAVLNAADDLHEVRRFGTKISMRHRLGRCSPKSLPCHDWRRSSGL